MTQEEFLVLFRKVRILVDDAKSQQHQIGFDCFLTLYDRYKNYIFQDYTQECLDSSSFREYVWHMMCLTIHLTDEKEGNKIPLPSNVVSFKEYANKRAYN